MNKITLVLVLILFLSPLIVAQSATGNSDDENPLEEFFKTLGSDQNFQLPNNEFIFLLTGIKDDQPLNIIILASCLFILLIPLINQLLKFSEMMKETPLMRILASFAIARAVSFNGTFNMIAEFIFNFFGKPEYDFFGKTIEIAFLEDPIIRFAITIAIIIVIGYAITQTIKQIRIQTGEAKSGERAFELGYKLKHLLGIADTTFKTKP